METNKRLTLPAYLLAAVLTITPLLDGMMRAWPMHISDERWRFGVVGTMSNLFLVPMLGLLLAMFVATFSDGRRARRVVGAICAVLAVILAVSSVLFVLDYFQVRTLMRPNVQQAMAIATTTALIKNCVAAVILALLSRAGFSGPKAAVAKVKTRPAAPASSPLVSAAGVRTAPSE